MCGRFGFAFLENKDGNSEWFRLIDDEPVLRKDILIKNTRFDVRPSEYFPVIKKNNEGKITLENCRWGFHPVWSKTLIINTRSENLYSSGYWKRKISKRCLIPASYFYEWKEEDNKKYPYLIRLKNEKSFVFAGLYDFEKNPGTKTEEICFSILIQEANTLMRQVHNTGSNRFRQPVILKKESISEWLNMEDPSESDLIKIAGNYESDEIEVQKLLKTGNDKTHEKPVPFNGLFNFE